MQQNKTSRRNFLKTTTVLTGGAMLSGLPLAQAAHSLVDETIKIALIGCGGRGTGAAVQALLSNQNVKLVAMADAFRGKVDEAYKNITAEDLQDVAGVEGSVKGRVDVPEERKFVGFDAYKKAIALADVVILATPPGFRPAHFEESVKYGKHVFMEKPVAVDGPGIRRVLAAAEEAKRRKLNVVVGLQRHYQAIYRQWIDKIHEGSIGDIIASRVYWNMGALWIRARKKDQTEMEYQMDNWYYFNWLCGDHIVEQHVHNLDVSNWAKQAYPIRAQGSGGRQVRIGRETGEIFDHHTVEFEYADGSRMFSQCRQIPGTKDSVTEGFHGTKGTAPAPGKILSSKGKTLMDYDAKKDPNPYQVEHDELFAAIAKGEYKFADAENAAKSTLTAILGRLATYSGQVVEWDAALNSQTVLMPEMMDWNASPRVLPGADGIYPCAVPGDAKQYSLSFRSTGTQFMDIFLMVISGILSFYFMILPTVYTYLLVIFSQLIYTSQTISFELSTHPKPCLSDGTRPRQVRSARVFVFPGTSMASTRGTRTWRGRVPSERQVNALTLPPQDALHRYEFTHPQMGTVFRLVMYTESETQAKTAAALAFAIVDSLNASMSDYLPESELSRLCNQAGNGQSVRVSEDLWQILKLSDGFSRQTGGAFDATVGPLTRLWRRARNLKELPDSARIEDARQLVGFQNIIFNKGKKIELKKAGMRLDLGGIAQGYAADRCLKILRKNGIRRALADAGGDIALGDAPPGETGWVIEIPSVQSEGVTSSQSKEVTSSHLLTSLRLANCGITTSGATFRYLEIGGKRYSHIVDPRTGWGLTHRVLVTVQAPDATTADAWATAISVLGESGWKKLKRKHRSLKVWLTQSSL